MLYAIQAAYSEDVSNAIENIGFFPVPFAVMFALLAAVDWTWALLRQVLTVVAGVAVVCAAIAISVERPRSVPEPRALRLQPAPRLLPRQPASLRPNLGRYLALAITALGAYMAWSGERRGARPRSPPGSVSRGWWSATRSPASSPCSPGSGIVALLRWGWRGAAGAALGLAGLAGLAIAGGTPTSDIQDYRSIDSGRESLLEGGVQLFEEKPTAGWGSGAFGRAFYEEIEQARSTISHSEPVTVAAEQGVIGLAVYVAFLFTALIALFDRVRGSLPRATVARFVAVLVHSLGYAGFAIDPVTWALLGLGVALRRGPPDGSVTICHVFEYLRRLATTGAAYTASSVLSKLVAVVLLPVYTAYLSPADYGAAEVMLASLVAASILIRFGLIEALMRFYYLAGEDPRQVVATGFAALFWLATAGPWSGSSLRTRSPRRFSTAPTPSSRASRCSASGC